MLGQDPRSLSTEAVKKMAERIDACNGVTVHCDQGATEKEMISPNGALEL